MIPFLFDHPVPQELPNIHNSKVTSVSLSPDSRTVLTCSRGTLSLSLSFCTLTSFFADETLKQIDIRTYSVVQVTSDSSPLPLFSHTTMPRPFAIRTSTWHAIGCDPGWRRLSPFSLSLSLV